jgi:hypothetical protein
MISSHPADEATGDFLKIHFTWDNHPEGVPKRQKARTHLRNSPDNYGKAELTLSLIKHELSGPTGLTVDEYVQYLPNSQLAQDIKNRTNIERVQFIDAVKQYHAYCDHLVSRKTLSPETARRYVRVLKGIPCRPLHDKNVCDLTRQDFHQRQLGWEGHKTFMQEDETAKSPKTIINNISAVNHFGQWALTNQLCDDTAWDALKPPKWKQKPISVFTPGQMERFIPIFIFMRAKTLPTLLPCSACLVAVSVRSLP